MGRVQATFVAAVGHVVWVGGAAAAVVVEVVARVRMAAAQGEQHVSAAGILVWFSSPPVAER